MPENKTIEVFCSYAHEDEIWFRKLEAHLSLSKRQGLFTLWYSHRISPGANKQQAINTHLETADVILLLVSADFLASDYCGIEMKHALERQQRGKAQVIPILIRQVDWKHAPFAHLHVLPTNAKPLNMWVNKDAALANISENLRRVIEGKPFSEANAPQSPSLSIWNVPYRRNPYFTGRDDLLDQLEQKLSHTAQNAPLARRSAALTQPQAIKGLGGIGKTQTAVEYAYRAREQGRYTHTLWVNAASDEAIITSFVTLADLLPSFSAKGETDQHKLVNAIKRWLEQCKQSWLLIFDNADDISNIQGYLPQRGNGSVLLTTRADAVGSLATSVAVEPMSFIEGTHLLLRRAQRFEHASDEEVNEAGNIVVALDHFPLALDQAGAYIDETKCSFVDYLQLYQEHRRILHARRGLQITNYPDSVATTWSLSFQKVEQASPAAAELLRLCAFLAPDQIPEELIRDGSAYWNPLLQQATTDLFIFNQMLEELLKFSLVKRLVENHMLVIHRLVQAVQIDTMEPEVQHQWAERVVRAINQIFPDPEVITTWPLCLRYLDQVQACHTLIDYHTLLTIEGAFVLNRASIYLKQHISPTIAEPLCQRALQIFEQQSEPDDFFIASALNNLADVYTEQARYGEAEPLFQRALQIKEHLLGVEHSSTATSLNNLASLYKSQGKYKQAEPLYQQALQIKEHLLGPNHLDIALSLDNLAGLYRVQGKYEQAELLYQRACLIYEQLLGTEHPDIATNLNNLAGLYCAQGKYEQAEPLYQRALTIREQLLGIEHSETAMGIHNLAKLYQDQGKDAEAEPLYLRALQIFERQLDAFHPDIAHSLHCLAKLYQDQGKDAEAEPLYLRTLQIFEQRLGSEHPTTTTCLSNLAGFYRAQGKYEQAEQAFKQVLMIQEQLLDVEHTDIADSLNNLAILYCDQEKYEQAEQAFEQVLMIREQMLGVEHLDTLDSFNSLGLLYQMQRKYEQAEPLLERALAIREQLLGPAHPDTGLSLSNLGSLYFLLRKYTEAELLLKRALLINEQHFGAMHLNTADSLNGLGLLYQMQGKYEQAELFLERALHIYEHQLEPKHPLLQSIRSNYITILRAIGRDDKVKKLEKGF